LAWLLINLISFPNQVQAADPFPQTVEIADKTLKKNGEALCEWGIFGLDLYRVALWVEKPSSNAKQLLSSEQVRCLELRFVRSLSQKQMREAYEESIKANQPANDKKLKASIQKFIESVKAASKGSSMKLICLPGKGLELRQGKEKILVEGDRQFLDLILKLYIGNKPPTPEVAKGLLGNHPNTVADLPKGPAKAEEKLKKVPEPDARQR